MAIKVKSTFDYKYGGQVDNTTELKTIISDMLARGLFFRIENAYKGRGKLAFYMVTILPGNNNND